MIEFRWQIFHFSLPKNIENQLPPRKQSTSQLISPHQAFIIPTLSFRIFPSTFLHLHFSIHIFPSTFFHPHFVICIFQFTIRHLPLPSATTICCHPVHILQRPAGNCLLFCAWGQGIGRAPIKKKMPHPRGYAWGEMITGGIEPCIFKMTCG